MRRPLALAVVLLACSDPPPPSPPQDAGLEPIPIGSTGSVAPPGASSPAERWGGRIRVPAAAAIDFEVTFTPGAAGAPATATLSIPAQKVSKAELKDVSYTADAMRFTLAQPGVPDKAQARFTIPRKGSEPTATGTLLQHGATMTVQMRRLKDGESIGDGGRDQTPKPPFPYEVREATYTSKDGTKLAGTFTFPKRDGKSAAVLMVTGTGSQDRDETLSGHKPFAVIADALTRAGVAVLRVDDRGVGGSGGDTAKTGFEGKVEDILAGMAWLSEQSGIDPTRIGLLGHSEGGILAPLAATSAGEPGAKGGPAAVAFVVLMAGPGVTGSALLRKQMEARLRVEGASEERVALGMKGQNKVIDAVLAGADDAALRKIVEEQVDAVLAMAGEKARENLGEKGRKNLIDVSLDQVATPAMRAFIRSDPAPTLAKVRCPVLAIGGTLDIQVPAEENLAAIRAALEKGKNPDITTESFPGLNHLFQPAKTGAMAEWAESDLTIEPKVVEKIATWVAERTKPKP